MKRAVVIATVLAAISVAIPIAAVPAGGTQEVATPSVGEVSAQALPRLNPVAWVGGLSQPTSTSTSPIDSRVFVTEQAGRIRVIRAGRLNQTPFLTISGLVSSGGERGLLGVAFSPRFRTDRLVYFTYTARDGAVILARVRARSATSDVAARTTMRTVLRIPHPDYSNHNGGALTFDNAGLLYMGTGDGGGSGDPLRTAQNVGNLAGKILRLDVSRVCGTRLFCVPAGNTWRTSPSANARLVWARGVRNPWKITTDAVAGNIWFGDVGQNQYEEVNWASPGARALNFGWSCREGRVVFDASRCGTGPYRAPVATLCHEGNVAGCRPPLVGRSITGGFVYRGANRAALRGAYVFGDFITGSVFALKGGVTQQIASVPYISTFGQMRNRELLVVNYVAGTIYRLV